MRISIDPTVYWLSRDVFMLTLVYSRVISMVG